MKNIIKPLGIPALALVAALSASCAVSAWTAPSSTPPLPNVDAPLNASVAAQTKKGSLTIDSTLTAKGFNLFGYGRVSVSEDYLTQVLPDNLLFGVNGNAGAQGFCDQNGENCWTAKQIAELIADLSSKTALINSLKNKCGL
jgi:hypothetical protein